MKNIVFTILLIATIAGYSGQAHSDANKIQNTEYFKSLKIQDEQTGSKGIIKLIEEAYKSPKKNKKELSALKEYLNQKSLRLSLEKELDPDYFYAYGLASMAYLESLENIDKKREGFENSHNAAYSNFAWYILTKEDIARCKYAKELEKSFDQQTTPITDGLKTYLGSITVPLKKDIFYIVKAVHEEAKNRNPNKNVCQKSDSFQKRLSETGAPIFQTMIDGKLHIHLKGSKEFNENSKQIGYVNTQKILPEYVSDEMWQKERAEIFKEITKQYFADIK